MSVFFPVPADEHDAALPLPRGIEMLAQHGTFALAPDEQRSATIP
jgi:hypothetical protein